MVVGIRVLYLGIGTEHMRCARLVGTHMSAPLGDVTDCREERHLFWFHVRPLSLALRGGVLGKSPKVQNFMGVGWPLWHGEGDNVGHVADVPLGLSYLCF